MQIHYTNVWNNLQFEDRIDSTNSLNIVNRLTKCYRTGFSIVGICNGEYVPAHMLHRHMTAVS